MRFSFFKIIIAIFTFTKGWVVRRTFIKKCLSVKLGTLSDISATLVDKLNGTKTLLNLVQYGDRFSSYTENILDNKLIESKQKWVKVPGCMANVHIVVNLIQNDFVELYGVADSRLARGLVALLCQVCLSLVVLYFARVIDHTNIIIIICLYSFVS